MYSPEYAVVKDSDKIFDIIQRFPLATIVYQDKGRPESFNLPLVLKNNRLIGHLARMNPASRILEKESVLFIFNGPDAYIRPSWYESEEDLPTWNYITVQVRGKVKLHQDEAFLRFALNALNEKYDPSYDLENKITKHQDLLINIIGIEVEIEETFAKFKLGQSKSLKERENVANYLREISGVGKEQLLAEEIEKSFNP